MAETLRLFVSATQDLEPERALIGRAVAQLPVQIGIEIRRTPVRGAAYEEIFELNGLLPGGWNVRSFRSGAWAGARPRPKILCAFILTNGRSLKPVIN
jgi:hypothetical protein